MKLLNCSRKIVAAIGLAACAFVAVADEAKQTDETKQQEMSLSDARKKIAEIVEDPSVMSDVMGALSAEDQVTFLGEINAAIARLPGDVETRTATLLNVDSAALRAAREGNLANLVGEVFATAFPESLAILSDQFAEDLFNRNAVQDNKPDDAQYIKIACETMEAVNKFVAEVDGGDARSAFAALMFIKASGSTSDEIFKSIGNMIPEKSREVALTEWLPEALGRDDKEQSYDALWAVLNGGVIPEITRTLEIAGPQFHDVLLSDLTGYNTEPFTKTSQRTPITDAIFNTTKVGRPIGGNSTINNPVTPQPSPEPEPYPGQTY